MARQKKDGRSVNFYLDRTIMEKVEIYANENGHTLTKAVERLLEKALDGNSFFTVDKTSQSSNQ